MICRGPSLPRPRKNCGPTPNPTANRNIRKKVDLIGPATVIPSWPMRTPASRVAVTFPSANPHTFNGPIANPTASAKNTASSG